MRDAHGNCFVGNLTVIPSGQGWVFMKIYKIFFFHLYGSVTISRNRLAITDEDKSEFGPFECLIASDAMFKFSAHMLCIFHALIQQFHKSIHPLLSARTVGGKQQLTRRGRNYCERHCFARQLLLAHDLI